MTILACLAGHPDRCHRYTMLTDAPVEACQDAARQWLAERPYLRGVALRCREESST